MKIAKIVGVFLFLKCFQRGHYRRICFKMNDITVISGSLFLFLLCLLPSILITEGNFSTKLSLLWDYAEIICLFSYSILTVLKINFRKEIHRVYNQIQFYTTQKNYVVNF